MRRWNVALGYYQNSTTAKEVIKELQAHGFYRIAYVQHKKDGEWIVKRYCPIGYILLALFLLFILGASFLLLQNMESLGLSAWGLVAYVGFSAALCASLYFWLNSLLIDKSIVEKFKNRLVADEILVMVQVLPREVREVLVVLRQVKSGHPVSFLLRSELLVGEVENMELRKEPLTSQQLCEQAVGLANELNEAQIVIAPGQPLLPRLKQSEKIIQFLQCDIAEAEHIEQTVTLSAEWLLDNMYIIEGSYEEVKRNLPKKYYRELPKIKNGPMAGMPRIYAIASSLINGTVGRLSIETIVDFLNSYQSVYPLTIGELWALPLMMRLRILEWVQCLAVQIDRRMREGELASFWGNRLLNAARREPEHLHKIFADLTSEIGVPSPHFGEELLDHLFDEEAVLPIVKKWLEDHFARPLGDVIREEQLQETAEQGAFSSSIQSLMMLSQLSWQVLFERVSPVDVILREDPVNIYQQMDFETRNCYRKIIEYISRRSHVSEVEVARRALLLSMKGTKPFERHIGYYLVDEGRSVLESTVAYRPKIRDGLRRWVKAHHSAIYLGGIAALTLAFEACFFAGLFRYHLIGWYSGLLAVLALFPLSELSVQLLNLLLTVLLPPIALPKLSFEKGIPIEFKTLIVVPTMLSSIESIKQDLQNLEIRYLANAHDSLLYSLFTDFTDAPSQHMEKDAELLQLAIEGIQQLESKYGMGKFYLFHRQRSWSQGENAWIGWERKRGKLECLNRYLMGEGDSEEIVFAGDKENLTGIRFVITLDADTQLPKGVGCELIETLAHPLNKPYLSPNGRAVLRGYTIIQPRVSTDFTQMGTTLFTRIFSDVATIDPYTQAVSNVYQDLTNEGTYHGKGIYDLEAFHRVISERYPDEHVLSHDLLEGMYGRVAFASDICAYDSFPEDYFSWAKRQHRWIRGDLQIADWLLPMIPSKSGVREANPLSAMSRWKVFDNLRRAFMPIAIILFLLSGWFYSPLATVTTLLGTFVLFTPWLLTLANKILHYTFRATQMIIEELSITFLRSVIQVAVLPYDAYNSFDAWIRVVYRRFVSHRHLLQWMSAGFGNRSPADSHRRFVVLMGLNSLFGLMVFILTWQLNPSAILLALPFCTLWLLSPWIVSAIDKPLDQRTDRVLSDVDRVLMRRIARKTWRYFDDLVGPQTQWLPPDNYQMALRVEVAPRTSPTNIGLWFTSLLCSYDFRFIQVDDVINRANETVHTLKRLERFEGHFLNWYNTTNAEPLYPRYISTVDSGNMLACFWTFKQGLYEMLASPLIPTNAFEGLKDTYGVLIEEKIVNSKVMAHLLALKEIFLRPIDNVASFMVSIQEALKIAQAILDKSEKESTETVYWFLQLQKQLDAWNSLCMRYFGWIPLLSSLPNELLHLVIPDVELWKKQLLDLNPSLQEIADLEFALRFSQVIAKAQQNEMPAGLRAWGMELGKAVASAQEFAEVQLGKAEEIVTNLKVYSIEMNLQFLYNKDRKLFAIGYNVDDRRLDPSYYDLLASEARIASLVGIAKGDVPLEHWWALGRPYAHVYGQRVLMSWGGTMFEYLMPLIFNKYYANSLLGQACNAVVNCQVKYGKERGIPWGISEAAFSAIDVHRIYQYRSFGIPGVGLKRGLEDDLVVSPYSSGLALAVNPLAAIANLKNMAVRGRLNLYGPYGYYESIDFSRQHGPHGERGVIVYAYMAHHQGMFFAAINNLLHNHILPDRFQEDPRIKGVEAILYEKIPLSEPVKKPTQRQEIFLTRLKPFTTHPIMGVVETPHSVTPKVNLLSNGTYSIMVTNAGGSCSRWRDIDVTRWRSDPTRDLWGNFFYLKDIQSGAYWSATYQPTQKMPRYFSASFKPDKAEFRRRDNQIETVTEVVVSPEDNAEIWLMTLTNHSSVSRCIELTSYIELALAPHAADRMHPVFNKLFIETEALTQSAGLIAHRRLRSSDEKQVWAAHVMALSIEPIGTVQFETNRSRFIGRGNNLQHPAALDVALSGEVGDVLDPIFSVRQRVMVDPGKRVQIAYITAIADSREGVLALVDKYKDIEASRRALGNAWTFAQLEMRHLRIHQEDVQLFQKLASRIFYPHKQLRASEERQKSNRLGQSGLWAHGISGDLPIVVVTVGDVYDLDMVKQILVAHTFWSMRGLKVDLVIINEEMTTYENPLQDNLQRMIQAQAYRVAQDAGGRVFLLMKEQVTPEELNLILAVSSALLVAARGSLRQQLVSPLPAPSYPMKINYAMNPKEYPSNPLSFMELPYFNGLGGFTKDGRCYVIYLDMNQQTPAPWVNILANPSLGFIATECGLGATWYGNSQSNRLTPWSNDPTLNPITDTLFLRDEDTGVLWSTTPKPIREKDAYRTTHSQGYTRYEHNSHGIDQDLLVFVPVDDKGGLPLRIQRLRLKNKSPKARVLSVTAYSELVLGKDKEETQMHVITEWDSESQALFAYNRYNSDYGDHMAFSSSVIPANSFTGDRTEFIGRNGTLQSPTAMKRRFLSGRCGSGLDPCAALQVIVNLEPDEQKDVIFVLGYTADAVTARQLIHQCRAEGMIDQLFNETMAWWDRALGTLQVDVPDQVINFSMNRWLLYQNLSCRFWGRTAFYQSSGAYGFRDQLQDAMALVYSLPSLAKEQILRAAAHQFLEGDVQHWWHQQSGGGVRTRISDDLLWLPFVTAHYVRVTGDVAILEEKIPFIEAPLLAEDQHEAYCVPTVSQETGTLLEHCRRAVQKGTTAGSHGLPLMGCGDWNDGMNRIGIEGKGESVWLGWFLVHVMQDFADLLTVSGHGDSAEGFYVQAKRLAEAVEGTSWDGEWYRRAYFDDGTPLGSKVNQECSIDAIVQSWAAISGKANPERVQTALHSAFEHLVKPHNDLVLLLTPSFDHFMPDPGYIKGYPPGVRENGGQYTHGSLWLAMAFARIGDGGKAAALLRMMHPLTHAQDKDQVSLYKVEPYAVAADIYNLAGQVGRGGWTWYTGAAGWMYRIWLEEVLGFHLRANKLTIDCTIPSEWNGFKIEYKYKNTPYQIEVTNPHHISKGATQVVLDGVMLPGPEVTLVDDGRPHIVKVEIIKDKV